MPHTIISNDKKYLVLDHAILRFKERYKLLYDETITNPIAKIQTLLDTSCVDIIAYKNYKRQERHNRGNTTHQYLTSDGWRLVIADYYKIVTIERVRPYENKV